MPKSKAYSNPLPSMADEQRYGTKCHELRAKIREIERENQNIQLKIHQSKKNISRLRIERSVLYEALATITTTAAKAAELPIPTQIQQPTSEQTLYPPSNPIPATSIPPTHNGYHTQNFPSSNRPFNETAPTSNNHAPVQAPNRNFNRSTEPLSLNGITGLLNSNNNSSHHPPRPPISHSQYSQTLPAQQTQVTNHRMPVNPHQLAPMSVDPTNNTRYSSAASESPTASNNHFPHHPLGGRSMSASIHHHHNHFQSPHHHHHHHQQHHHRSEHLHTNSGSTSVLPSLRSHPTGAQTHSNGNGISLRPDARVEAEVEEAQDEEEEDDEEEEEEELDEVDGSIQGGSASLRPADDEMEIEPEGDEE